MDTTSENGGVLGELVVAVLDSSGYIGQVSFGTWDTGLAKVEQGSFFGVFPLVKSAEREESFVFSDPLIDFKYVLFYKRDAALSREVLDGNLKGQRVGLIDGYDYWPELTNSGAEFATFASTLDGFEALNQGEIDLLAESDLVGQSTLRSESFSGDFGDFTVVPSSSPVLSSEDTIHFVMRKSNYSDTVLADFNASLAEFKTTQQYEQLLTRLDVASDHVVFRGEELIIVRDREGEPIGSVPQGVTASVLEWPDTLSERSEVELKMLDGPLAGRIGFVSLEDVEVDHVQS